jgi:hypothetical protein
MYIIKFKLKKYDIIKSKNNDFMIVIKFILYLITIQFFY